MPPRLIPLASTVNAENTAAVSHSLHDASGREGCVCSRGKAGYTRCSPLRLWRNWQTRMVQVHVGVISRGGSTPLSRIAHLVRRCISRSPSDSIGPHNLWPGAAINHCELKIGWRVCHPHHPPDRCAASRRRRRSRPASSSHQQAGPREASARATARSSPDDAGGFSRVLSITPIETPCSTTQSIQSTSRSISRAFTITLVPSSDAALTRPSDISHSFKRSIRWPRRSVFYQIAFVLVALMLLTLPLLYLGLNAGVGWLLNWHVTSHPSVSKRQWPSATRLATTATATAIITTHRMI